jgi:hypothetical protein
MPSIDDWQREMERYLSHFTRSGKRPTIVFATHGQPTPTWTPSVDMYETEQAMVIVFDGHSCRAAQTRRQGRASRARGDRLAA